MDRSRGISPMLIRAGRIVELLTVDAGPALRVRAARNSPQENWHEIELEFSRLLQPQTRMCFARYLAGRDGSMARRLIQCRCRAACGGDFAHSVRRVPCEAHLCLLGACSSILPIRQWLPRPATLIGRHRFGRPLSASNWSRSFCAEASEGPQASQNWSGRAKSGLGIQTD